MAQHPRVRARGTAVAGALALAAAALLAGCTGPGSPTASPSPSPTVAIPSPTAEPSPTRSAAPQRPDAMDRDDVEGAIAAAQYFLELYPYAYNTGDLAEWKALSHPECIFCASVVEGVEELHASGGYETGGEIVIQSASARPPLEGNEFFAVDFELVQLASIEISVPDAPRESPEARLLVQMAVRSAGGQWTIRAVSYEELQ